MSYACAVDFLGSILKVGDRVVYPVLVADKPRLALGKVVEVFPDECKASVEAYEPDDYYCCGNVVGKFTTESSNLMIYSDAYFDLEEYDDFDEEEF